MGKGSFRFAVLIDYERLYRPRRFNAGARERVLFGRGLVAFHAVLVWACDPAHPTPQQMVARVDQQTRPLHSRLGLRRSVTFDLHEWGDEGGASVRATKGSVTCAARKNATCISSTINFSFRAVRGSFCQFLPEITSSKASPG